MVELPELVTRNQLGTKLDSSQIGLVTHKSFFGASNRPVVPCLFEDVDHLLKHFFNVGPPKEDVLHIKNHKLPAGPLRAAIYIDGSRAVVV